MTEQIERRYNVGRIVLEQRGGQPAVIRGHAAVFNQLSEDLGGFREKIAPGAFADAIRQDDVRALINHDPNFVLGRNIAGTLRMTEDAQGLSVEIHPPDTQAARDLVVSMKRGDITQMSFGFSVQSSGQNWSKDDAGQYIRPLTRVQLFDVSPVTFPAYPQTDVALRSSKLFIGGTLRNPTPWRRNLRQRQLEMQTSN